MTFRPLVVQRVALPIIAQQEFVQHTILTTLAGQDNLPFGRTSNFPNPVLSRYQSPVNLTHIQNIPNGLRNPRIIAKDFPNPVRAKTNLIDFFNAMESQLIGQDMMLGAAGEVQEYDWPNPVRPRIRNEFGYVVSINPNLVAASVAITGVVGTTSAGTFAITTTGAPFAQSNWPNPLPSIRNEVGFVYSYTAGYPAPVTYLIREPTIQSVSRRLTDYSVSVFSQASQKTADVYFPASFILTGVAATASAGSLAIINPFIQINWPNPVLRTRQEIGFVYSYTAQFPLATVRVFREPTVQSVARKVTDFNTAIQSQTSQRSSPIQMPFVLNGVVATASAGNIVWPSPFNQYDWPNPVLRKRTEFGQIDFMVLNTFDTVYDASGQVPFYDWTNPVRPRVRNEFGFIAPSKPFIVVSPNINITGVFGTASAGVVLTGTLLGVVGTAAAGTFSTTITSNISITGAVGTATVGALIPNPDAIITGVAGIATIGSIIPQVGAIISGVFGTTIAGSIVLSGGPTAIGVTATAAAGNLVPSVAVAVTGVVGTTSAGTVIPSVAVTTLGVVATTSVGNITPSVTPNVTGVVGTTSAGTVIPSVAKALTGAAASGGVGIISFSGAVNAGVTGVVGTTSAGVLTVTTGATISIIGAVATATTGNATISTTASPALTGVVATASVGAALPQDNISTLGVVATAGAGTVKSTVSGIPAGVVANATAGTVASLIQTAIQGAQITTSAGTVSDIIQHAILGAQVSIQVGNIINSVSSTANVLGALASTQAGIVTGTNQNFAVVATPLGVTATAYVGHLIPTSTSYHIKKIKTQITVSRVRVDMT